MAVDIWDANSIYESFLSKPQFREESDLTIIKHDLGNQIVIGFTNDGAVFLGCKQIGDIHGFNSPRAKLTTMQEIEINELGLIKPAFILKFSISNEEELLAISTVFSGIYELNATHSDTGRATEAAQGFEDFLSNFSKVKLNRNLEVGLFGELSLISASTNGDLLVKGWQTVFNSTFDFSANGSRLEVKTSTRPTRYHWLRNSQSLDSSSDNLFYLSIYAPEDPSGINLLDLLDRIKQSLTDEGSRLLDEKLEIYDLEKCSLRFDYQQTINSFNFFEAADIPVPIFEDDSIIEVKWKCDFNKIKAAKNFEPWETFLS